MDFVSFLPQFGSLFFTLLAFILALSVIVAVHEYGHYIVGRWTGIKADVFSIGFGPVLFSRHDRHGTRWQVALLPFGGYVKFKGDENAASANTSDGTTTMSSEERRQTMQGAPLWARTATVAAGPIFNFILSIIVFAGIGMSQGQWAEPLTIDKVRPLPVEGITLQPGDEVLEIEGVAVPAFEAAEGGAFGDFVADLPLEPLLEYTVLRDGREARVMGPHPQPPLARSLAPQSAASSSPMRAGDVILSLGGTEVVAFSQLVDIVEGSEGRPLETVVWRGGEVLSFDLTPRSTDEPQPDGGYKTVYRIGIASGFAFEAQTEAVGPLDAVIAGVAMTWNVITSSLSGLYHMITGAISSCNMSGPIGIAQVSGDMASQGAESFIRFIAVLSTAVGLLNLFPIPILDGGHLVFYAYEAVFRKPPSELALRILMTVGLAFILTVMLFAVFNDIFCP